MRQDFFPFNRIFYFIAKMANESLVLKQKLSSQEQKIIVMVIDGLPPRIRVGLIKDIFKNFSSGTPRKIVLN